MKNAKQNIQSTERVRLTNIVGETKKSIMDEFDSKAPHDPNHITDEDVKIAVELLNPDPNSLKSRG